MTHGERRDTESVPAQLLCDLAFVFLHAGLHKLTQLLKLRLLQCCMPDDDK